MREFLESHVDTAAEVSVVDKDYTAGPDSGLVVVSLSNASTVTYIQPVIREGAPQWLVTFEARGESFDLDFAGVARLAADLTTIAAHVRAPPDQDGCCGEAEGRRFGTLTLTRSGREGRVSPH